MQRTVLRPENRLRIDELGLLVLALVVAGFAFYFLFNGDTQVAGATLLGGLVVAVGTYRTVQATREGQITDRFAKAIGQLGDDVPEVRLGGIYALERIARDSRRDHGAVVEVLTAYVRTRAPARNPVPQTKARCERSSVQAVIAVLGRRNVVNDAFEPRGDRRRRMDLSGADLSGMKFGEGDFGRVKLRESNLTDADLYRTNLRGAELNGAILEGANFAGADLEGAKLDATRFQGAHHDSETKGWADGPDPAAHAADNPLPGCQWCVQAKGARPQRGHNPNEGRLGDASRAARA